MGRDRGHHRDRDDGRPGPGCALSAAQLHPGAAGDVAGPHRPVGGDDAAGFHCRLGLHAGAGAQPGRGPACDPVLDPDRAHHRRDCPDRGFLGLDAAALVRSQDITATLAGLAALLREQRVELVDLQVRKASLEDVFLKLTNVGKDPSP